MLLALLACAPPPSGPADTGAAPGPGGPLDVACAPLAASSFAAPTPWATVSPAFEAYVDDLAASPYRDPGHEHAVEDLAAFDGALYAGLGDTSTNVGSRYCAAQGGACPWEDADGHGVPVFRFGPGAATAGWDHVVHEEEVSFRRLGDRLVVPSLDPTEGDPPLDCQAADAEPACPEEPTHPRFQVGTARWLQGGAWTESATIPTALHVFDVTVADGRWYAAGSSQPAGAEQDGFATVWGSADGIEWEVEHLDADRVGTRRITVLLPFVSGVVGLGYHAGDEVSVRVERREGAWVELPELAPWVHGLVHGELFEADRAVVWTYSEAALLTDGPDGVDAAPLAWLPEGSRVIDAWLACRGDLLVLTRGSDGQEHTVFRTADGVEAVELARWVTTDTLVSMAPWEGDLYFGDDAGRLWRADGEPVR